MGQSRGSFFPSPQPSTSTEMEICHISIVLTESLKANLPPTGLNGPLVSKSEILLRSQNGSKRHPLRVGFGNPTLAVKSGKSQPLLPNIGLQQKIQRSDLTSRENTKKTKERKWILASTYASTFRFSKANS